MVPGPKRSAQSGPASLPKKWLPARQQGEGAAATAPRAQLPMPPRSSWPGSFSLARPSTGRANTVAEARAALAALDAVWSRTCDAGAVGGAAGPWRHPDRDPQLWSYSSAPASGHWLTRLSGWGRRWHRPSRKCWRDPLWALVTVQNRLHGRGAGLTLGRVLERPGHSRAWGLGCPGEQKEGARANLGTGGVGRQCRWAGRGDGPTSATSVAPGRGPGPCGRTGWVGVGWRPGAVPGRPRRQGEEQRVAEGSGWAGAWGPERPVPWSVTVRGVGPGFSLVLEPEVWTFQLLSCGK